MKNQRHARPFSLVLVLLLTCAIALSALFLTTGTARAAAATSPSCQVTYAVVVQWPASSQAPGGFEVNLSILNTGSTTINGWALHFTFPNGQVIFSGFGGGNFTQAGADVTITNLSFNATVAPGTTVFYSPGFNANWWGSNNPPTAITLNNTLCTLVTH